MASIRMVFGRARTGDIEQAVASADVRLFEAIPAELTQNDRVSLISCQNAMRSAVGEYVYLEIGSHLGGSIQPHLLDPRCTKIISIDTRPRLQADERGARFAYSENSTAAMLARLHALAPAQMPKVQTFDIPAPAVTADQIGVTPHLLFIDGEHTDKAAYDDYVFCERVCRSNGVIVFHDASIVYNALASIVGGLNERKVPFRAYHLPDTIFVIELGGMTLLTDRRVAELALNNYVGYLTALRLNDGYRRFANLWPFRMLRHGAYKIGLRSWAARHGYGLSAPYRHDP